MPSAKRLRPISELIVFLEVWSLVNVKVFVTTIIIYCEIKQILHDARSKEMTAKFSLMNQANDEEGNH